MFALVLRDRYTGWLDCYDTGTKSAEDTTEALQHFVGPTEKVNLFYTDDAPELKAAAKGLGWRHSTSTPGRPQNNGIAERAVRTVLDGARAILHASGLPSRWWSRAVRFIASCITCRRVARGNPRRGSYDSVNHSWLNYTRSVVKSRTNTRSRTRISTTPSSDQVGKRAYLSATT